MKSTGIVRKLDSLGRVVLPIELLRVLDIHEKDALEFFIDDANQQIMMKSYLGSGCFLCKEVSDNMTFFKGKLVCQDCINEVKLGMYQPVMVNNEKNEYTQEQRKVITPQEEMNISHTHVKNEPSNLGVKKHKREETAQKLLEEHRKHPDFTQTKLAKVLGVTAPYVNILVKELRKRGEWDKEIRKAE